MLHKTLQTEVAAPWFRGLEYRVGDATDAGVFFIHVREVSSALVQACFATSITRGFTSEFVRVLCSLSSWDT